MALSRGKYCTVLYTRNYWSTRREKVWLLFPYITWRCQFLYSNYLLHYQFTSCYWILSRGKLFLKRIFFIIIDQFNFNLILIFFSQILREITACHGHSEYQRRHFFQELYKKSFPPPGTSITLTEPTIEETYVQNEHMGYGSLTGSPMKTVTIRRRADHRLDEGDLVTLVSTVDLSIVIKLFGSLLLERKVVLLSRALR